MDKCNFCYRLLNRHLPLRPLALLFLGTFLVFLPVLCYNLQYSSYFFPGNLNYAAHLARRRDERRMANAETYFAQLEKHRLPSYTYGGASKRQPARDGPTLSIVITAVNRNTHEVDEFEPHYLTQTLHALLRALDADVKHSGVRWHRVNVSICNVDAYPDKFGEAERLSRVVPVFQRHHPTSKRHPLCKEKEDFAFCLSRATERDHNDYVVVLEDDMLAQVDAVGTLWDLVQTRLPRRFGQAEGGIAGRLGSVQLHTPLKDYQYSLSDSSSWLELMLLSGAGTFVLFFFYFRLYCRPYNAVSNVAMLSALGFYSLFVLVLIGRPHVLNARHAILRQYSLSDAPGPNFSAVLFPAKLAGELAAFVQGAECSAQFTKAGAVQRYVEAQGRRTLAFYPSLFHHIGLYSVYRQDTIYPFDVEA